jgi:uncharacterized protein YwgA
MAKPDRIKAAEIIRDAGGEIVGRTRLQKVAYLLELVGLGDGFDFTYHHYGPYSEDLSQAVRLAVVFDDINECEGSANWGGRYSIYKYNGDVDSAVVGQRAAFAKQASSINAVELELAATAAYLKAVENSENPWGETERLKPEKATEERLAGAKEAYRRLSLLNVPNPLPAIV